MTKLKQERDKQLLNLEIFVGVLVSIIFLACVFVASFVEIEDAYRLLLIVVGFIFFVTGVT